MVDINYDKWTVESAARKAIHESGLYIEFSGSPSSNNFSGNPKNIPDGIAALEQVRLIRHGFEAYRAAFTEREPTHASEPRESSFAAVTPATPGLKTKITVKKRRKFVLEPQNN